MDCAEPPDTITMAVSLLVLKSGSPLNCPT